MKNYQLFTESVLNINVGDYVRTNWHYYLWEVNNPDKRIFKVLYKYHSGSTTNAIDGGKDNLFNVIDITDKTEYCFHKDFLEKLTKKESEKIEVEQTANKYNL